MQGLRQLARPAEQLLDEADKRIADFITEAVKPESKSERPSQCKPSIYDYANSTVQASPYPSTSSVPWVPILSTAAFRYGYDNVTLNRTLNRTGQKRQSTCGHMADLGANYCQQCGKRVKWTD